MNYKTIYLLCNAFKSHGSEFYDAAASATATAVVTDYYIIIAVTQIRLYILYLILYCDTQTCDCIVHSTYLYKMI